MIARKNYFLLSHICTREVILTSGDRIFTIFYFLVHTDCFIPTLARQASVDFINSYCLCSISPSLIFTNSPANSGPGLQVGLFFSRIAEFNFFSRSVLINHFRNINAEQSSQSLERIMKRKILRKYAYRHSPFFFN